MGDGPEFKAVLLVQDGLRDGDLGLRYLIQTDVKVEYPRAGQPSSQRIFIDVTSIVLRASTGTLPSDGEYYLDSMEADGASSSNS